MKHQSQKQASLWRLILPEPKKLWTGIALLVLFLAFLLLSIPGAGTPASALGLSEWQSVFVLLSILCGACLFSQLIDLFAAAIALSKCIGRLKKNGLFLEAVQEFTALCGSSDAVLFGENFIFGKYNGVVYPYSDIAWCYTRMQSFALFPVREILILATRDGRQNPIQSDGTGKRVTGAIGDVMERIFSRDPDLPFGFTKSNQMAYQTLVREDKNKN